MLIKKIGVDRDMNYPKNPTVYYTNRLKKYNNMKILVENFSLNWPEKNNLLELIQEKIKNNLSHQILIKQ